MMVLSLFIIGLIELFFYTQKGSIIPAADLPTTDIIEPVLPSTVRKFGIIVSKPVILSIQSFYGRILRVEDMILTF